MRSSRCRAPFLVLRHSSRLTISSVMVTRTSASSPSSGGRSSSGKSWSSDAAANRSSTTSSISSASAWMSSRSNGVTKLASRRRRRSTVSSSPRRSNALISSKCSSSRSDDVASLFSSTAQSRAFVAAAWKSSKKPSSVGTSFTLLNTCSTRRTTPRFSWGTGGCCSARRRSRTARTGQAPRRVHEVDPASQVDGVIAEPFEEAGDQREVDRDLRLDAFGDAGVDEARGQLVELVVGLVELEARVA